MWWRVNFFPPMSFFTVDIVGVARASSGYGEGGVGCEASQCMRQKFPCRLYVADYSVEISANNSHYCCSARLLNAWPAICFDYCIAARCCCFIKVIQFTER